MPSPLSVGLRARCVLHLGLRVLPRGCHPLRGECSKRQSLVGTQAAGRACGHSAAIPSATRLEPWAASPKPSGGDQLSQRIEAHKGLILAACRRKPAIFLRELRASLAQRWVQTSTSGLSRFFLRHGISRKKGTSMPPSRTGRT